VVQCLTRWHVIFGVIRVSITPPILPALIPLCHLEMGALVELGTIMWTGEPLLCLLKVLAVALVMVVETLVTDPVKPTLVWVPMHMEGMLDQVVQVLSTNQAMDMQGTLEIQQEVVAPSMETQLGDLNRSLMELAHLVMGLGIQLQMLQQRAQQVTWGIDW
jgi:hypothetical protein